MMKTARRMGLLGREAPEFGRGGLLAILIVALAFLGGCGSDDTSTATVTADATVTRGAADDKPRHLLTQPEVRRSARGVLDTDLRMAITHNRIIGPNKATPPGHKLLQKVRTPNYEGRLTGPTLVVKPGDTLKINLINDFPENPESEREGTVPGQSPQFPHDPWTTNLHTHGLLVTPQGIGDNIYREMPPFPETLDNNYQFEVEIPFDHPIGTFWYHPHKHGSASYQFYGGMAGFLIIEGGEGTLDLQPEVHAAKDVLIAFQAIRVLQDDAPRAGGARPGQVPFINEESSRFSNLAPEVLTEEQDELIDDGMGNLIWPPEELEEATEEALWGPYLNTNFWLTANGKVNPSHIMYEGEVQRWRMVNALAGHTLVLVMEGHDFNIVAHDGLTMPEMQIIPEGEPYVLDAGSRGDILVKAGAPGTYKVMAIDARFPPFQFDNTAGVTVQNVANTPEAPGFRTSQVANAIPSIANGEDGFPFTLMTVEVHPANGKPEMDLPSGPLPVDQHLVDLQNLIYGDDVEVDAHRNVAFELCGMLEGQTLPEGRLPSCAVYSARYQAQYWGGEDFDNMAMMRDDDDTNFEKDGLFNAFENLFDDMYAGNVEEWTIINRSFSDHPFHIHQNPFLLTHVNGIELPVPEWHDTVLVPSANPDLDNFTNINFAEPGTITFRTYLDPRTKGRFVAHCHILTHEDVGMMQALEIKDRPASATAQN